jgi:hypothetical protein
VFQVCKENPEPILPGFAPIGGCKFEAVIKLAEAYREAAEKARKWDAFEAGTNKPQPAPPRDPDWDTKPVSPPPPIKSANDPDGVGEGWRLMKKYEWPIEGDEFENHVGRWEESTNWLTEAPQSERFRYRRRIESPAPIISAEARILRQVPNSDGVMQNTPTNCFSACVATVLGIDIGDVPIACDGATWDWDGFQNWLAKHGLQAIEVGFGNGGTIYPITYPVPCILTGNSPRECTTGRHAVVATFIGLEGFECTHDPHISKNWIDGEPTHALFFVDVAPDYAGRFENEHEGMTHKSVVAAKLEERKQTAEPQSNPIYCETPGYYRDLIENELIVTGDICLDVDCAPGEEEWAEATTTVGKIYTKSKHTKHRRKVNYYQPLKEARKETSSITMQPAEPQGKPREWWIAGSMAFDWEDGASAYMKERGIRGVPAKCREVNAAMDEWTAKLIELCDSMSLYSSIHGVATESLIREHMKVRP